jgi:hypothetical protein
MENSTPDIIVLPPKPPKEQVFWPGDFIFLKKGYMFYISEKPRGGRTYSYVPVDDPILFVGTEEDEITGALFPKFMFGNQIFFIMKVQKNSRFSTTPFFCYKSDPWKWQWIFCKWKKWNQADGK